MGPSFTNGLDRREWIFDVLQSLSATALVPLLHAGEQTNTTQPWTPQFFSASQNETLIALGERIIPGSKEALCNRVIDVIIAIESEKNKRQFVNALVAFDKAARSKYGKPFQALSTAQQNSLLHSASSAHGAMQFQFNLVKEWFADTYWSSQKGLRELGWTGQMAWPSYPGCPHHNQA